MSEVKVIVSLTSHSPERMKNVGTFLFHSIYKHQFNFVKVVLTLYKDDVQYLTNDLKELINSNQLELIIADEDLGSNLKYFYCMKKYRDLPIITIDDDSIYPEMMIPDFLEHAKKYPNTVICRSAKILNPNNKYYANTDCNSGIWKVTWNKGYDEVSSTISPEGYGGIYYPENILDINDDMIPEIKADFKRADDIYLTLIERRKGIKCILPNYNYNKLDVCTRPAYSLCLMKDNCDMINKIFDKYGSELK